MITNVLEWLESTAERLPDKVAIRREDDALTYAQLLEQARIAGTWIAPQACPRTAVVLYLEKSPAAYAAMLGAAYAGCFYSVVDVRQPAARALSICERLAPSIILTDAANEAAAHELFANSPWPIRTLDEICGPADDALLAAIRAQATDVDPLYVTFTSGSTGTPKGVVTAHRSVLDFASTFARTFGIQEDDILGNQAPFDFDASVKDLYSAMQTGATVLLIPRDYYTNPTRLMDYICDNEVTNLTWAVSAMCFVSIMNGFDYRVPTTVRRVLFSGEVMPPKQLSIWQRALTNTMFVNLYGPTESTCNCAFFIVDREYAKDEVIPMGHAFDNERIFLLDDSGKLVTEAETPGELYVGGSTLALGYLNDPAHTAEAFVQNPLNNRWLETVYRTGDLAKYDEAGNLVYISRKDNQIKHLGQRIELGEIEAVAQGIDGVTRAVCLYDSKRKRIHLVYIGDIEKGDLSASLKEALPQYMVPNRIHQVDAMPLNKNGKTDRHALEAVCRIR